MAAEPNNSTNKSTEPAEWFPLKKDGKMNRDLMSFTRLYADEIVETIQKHYSNQLIDLFLMKLKYTDVEVPNDKELLEWLVFELIQSQAGFEELYKFLCRKNPCLLDQICLRKENIEPSVMKPFIKHFMCTAPDIIQLQFKDLMEERGMNDTLEDLESEYEESELDSDDELPEDYVLKKKRKPDIKDPDFKDRNRYDYEDTVLDKLSAVFDPEFALAPLERAYAPLREVKDPLNTPSTAHEMNARPWARAILRQLPRMAPAKEELDQYPSIVFNFANACKDDPYNRVALTYLMPDYSIQLLTRDAAIRGMNKQKGIRMDTVKEDIKHCRPPEDYVNDRRGIIRDYQSTAMPIHLREYQKELVEHANMGENTVIVAPTGSGKTVVAAQIMRCHVFRRKAMNKPYRMVMVVPKIPLVDQQQKQLYQYMADVVYSDVLHGDMMFEEQAKIEKILCAELIVMTPQILINLLESVRAKERLFVSDITMLILDECHHCCSNHPYAQLMNIVRAWEHDKPQIVGLTASLGVGKDGTLNEHSAHYHVVQLLARMTAISISSIVHNTGELLDHVQLPVDEIKDVPRLGSDESLPFTTHIKEFMNKINMAIRGNLKQMTKPGNETGALIPQSLLQENVNYNETERYGGRIEAIRQAIKPMRDGSIKNGLMMALDALKICSMTLGMNDLLPSSLVLPQMIKEMRSLQYREEMNEFVVHFFTIVKPALEFVQNIEEDKPMLRALRKELQQQLAKNATSKVIIFVATRELSQCVSDYINDRRDQIEMGDDRECGFIISSKARGVGTVSQSPIEQKQALTKFRNNKLAVLVSTTVAEEGLDVPECNLIIKYNMTGNVISLTQQRGRARAKDSKSVLIVLSGSVKRRELENANAEKMMNHIVRKIHREGRPKLKSQVLKESEQMKLEEARIEQENENKMHNLQANIFEIQCVNCNTYLCESYKIKSGGSHYFAADGNIWNSVKLDPAELKSKYVDVVTTVIGKALCVQCGNDLGKVVRYHGCYMPALKCLSLQLKNKKDYTSIGMDMTTNKKIAWKEVADTHFFINKINDGDVAEMIGALSSSNPELFEILEARCKEVCRKTRREAQRKFETNKTLDETVREYDSD